MSLLAKGSILFYFYICVLAPTEMVESISRMLNSKRKYFLHFRIPWGKLFSFVCIQALVHLYLSESSYYLVSSEV